MPAESSASDMAAVWLSSTDPASEVPPPQPAHKSGSWFASLLCSPFLWGTVATVAFYSAIPVIPYDQAFLYRYFCSHWVLYATTWLFAIGVSILIQKGLRLPQQQAGLQINILRDNSLAREQDWQRRLTQFQRRLAGAPTSLRHSELGTRFSDACDYLQARRTGNTLEEHLKYLHEIAVERLSDSYALVRTIIWAIPILGFLGTVIGITLAITSITPEQLESSMATVTSGLAVAFDTTALSLSLSMIVVFVSFLVERAEQSILSRVESLTLREFAPLFISGPAAEGPLDQAEREAANHLLARTTAVVDHQTQAWHDTLLQMRSRWEQTLELQQQEFARAIQSGMQATLQSHLQEVHSASRDLLTGFQGVARNLGESLVGLQGALQQQQADQLAAQQARWAELQHAFADLRTEQGQYWQGLVNTLTEQLQSWQQELQAATQTGTAQLHELHSQGAVLLRIVSEESDLTRLQHSLEENLESVRAVARFEEVLHSLNAAVHMLSARSRAA